MTKNTTSNLPQVGQWADHKTYSLDARRIADVREYPSGSGVQIKLDIFGTYTDWVDADDYEISGEGA